MKIKFRIKVWRNRIETLRKDILIPAIIFFISILLIELKLKYIPASSEVQYDLGQIYLKLCYSFSAAVLFYFVVIHLPRERRKMKSFLYINNRSLEIDREIRLIVDTINKVKKLELNVNTSELVDYENAFKAINPQSGFLYSIESDQPFNNWFEYLKYKGDKIKKIIREILMLNDAIESDFLQSLTYIDNDISMYMNFDRKKWGNNDLTTWSRTIFDIISKSKEMTEIMRTKYQRYSIEYHEEYRKKKRNKMDASA